MTSTEPIVISVDLALAPACACAAFTAHFADWWPIATHSLSRDDATRCRFDACVGGAVDEQAPDGTRHVWGEVLAVEPDRRVRFSWHPGREPASAQWIEVEFLPTATEPAPKNPAPPKRGTVLLTNSRDRASGFPAAPAHSSRQAGEPDAEQAQRARLGDTSLALRIQHEARQSAAAVENAVSARVLAATSWCRLPSHSKWRGYRPLKRIDCTIGVTAFNSMISLAIAC